MDQGLAEEAQEGLQADVGLPRCARSGGTAQTRIDPFTATALFAYQQKHNGEIPEDPALAGEVIQLAEPILTKIGVDPSLLSSAIVECVLLARALVTQADNLLARPGSSVGSAEQSSCPSARLLGPSCHKTSSTRSEAKSPRSSTSSSSMASGRRATFTLLA